MQTMKFCMNLSVNFILTHMKNHSCGLQQQRKHHQRFACAEKMSDILLRIWALWVLPGGSSRRQSISQKSRKSFSVPEGIWNVKHWWLPIHLQACWAWTEMLHPEPGAWCICHARKQYPQNAIFEGQTCPNHWVGGLWHNLCPYFLRAGSAHVSRSQISSAERELDVEAGVCTSSISTYGFDRAVWRTWIVCWGRIASWRNLTAEASIP